MSKKRGYQKFNKEFIDTAVKLVETGKSAAQVARELGLPEYRVQNWVRAAREKASKADGVEDIIAENKRLKRELAKALEEAEILKKATAYFARHQL